MGELAIQSHLTPKLVDALYVEAMVLADEARSYFDTIGRDDRLSLDPIDRVGFSCESLKVTTRLMHVIAWLLTQRAVAAGELSRAQAGEAERRLGDAPQTDRDLFPACPKRRPTSSAPARNCTTGSAGSMPVISPTSRPEARRGACSAGCNARSEVTPGPSGSRLRSWRPINSITAQGW